MIRMRRIALSAFFAFLLLPAAAHAQVPRILVGGGLSTPTGDFSDVAGAGYHARAGLQLGVPAFPLAARLDGGYHSFGESDAGAKYKMLNGTLSAVLSLGGIGLSPYVIAGIGRYRIDRELGAVDPDATTHGGFHGGFGVNLGALGFGGFAELRYVQINTDGANLKYLPLTVGFRL
jgi:hypothetical protein